MIKFTLPILEQELVGNKLINTKKDMTCYLDVSATAQEVWEREFPVQAKNEGLFDYIERIKVESSKIKSTESSKTKSTALTISALKAIYCMIKFEKPLSKDEFLSLFTFTNADYFNELVSKLYSVFEAVYPDSLKNA